MIYTLNSLQAGELIQGSALQQGMVRIVCHPISDKGFDAIFLQLCADISKFSIVFRDGNVIFVQKCLINNHSLRNTTYRQPANTSVAFLIDLQRIGIEVAYYVIRA